MSEVGTFLRYEDWRPSEKRSQPDLFSSAELLAKAGAILARYEAAGHILTLRGLHYQMLGPGYPNTDASYNRLKGVVSRGRLAGYLSWTAIEDMQRDLMGLRTHSGPAQALNAAARGYRRDLWADQQWRPEVWIEKAAGIGTIANICNQLRVDYFACRGYNSQTEQWKAGQRFADYIRRGQRPIILHIGDHDPSGLHMTEDIRERVSLFCGVPVLVQRLALNIGQVQALALPPNPTKDTDARTPEYVERFGEECWELDACTPEYLQQLIQDAVDRLRDAEVWEQSLTQEAEEVRVMQEFAARAGGPEDED